MTDVAAAGTLRPEAPSAASSAERTRAAAIDVAGESLARTAAHGVAWSLAATFGGRLVSVASLAVLARLLSPADFGLVAFALVYMAYVETVADLGTAAALIWWPHRREDAAQAAFVTGIAMAAGWIALTMVAAPHLAAFFHVPAAESLIRALSWTFLLKALGNTHDALLQKDLRFRARALPEAGQALTRAALSVALAVAGLGAWSLAWGHLAGQAVWTALAWRVVPWRPSLRWPQGVMRPMLSYGRGVVAVNVLASVVHHADLVVVGRMLGATALGLYQVAYKLPEAAITAVVWVTSRVLFPTLSRLSAQGGALGAGWLAAARHVSLLTFPSAAVLAACAGPIVALFFGPRWAEAGPILAGLAVGAGVRSAGTNAGDVLKAAGRPGLLAGLGVLKAAVLLPTLVIAAPHGAAAVAWAMAGATVATSALGVAVSARYARVPLGSFAAAIAPAAGVASCAAAAARLALWLSPGALPLALAAGAATSVAAARVLAPDVFRSAWSTLRGPAGGILRAGRILAGGPDERLLRFLWRDLFVPRGRRESAIRALPDAIARLALLRRTPAPAWPPVAREALEGHRPLRDALDTNRWLAWERVTGGTRAGALLALFEEGDEAPAAALKLRPAAGASLRRERDMLASLRVALPPHLAATVPLPLDYRESGGSEALVLTWIRGRSMYVRRHAPLAGEGPARGDLDAAVEWLIALQSHTRGPARADLGGLDVTVPTAIAHGDFWARNILVLDGRVSGVVDWEEAREGRPVTDDLFHLLLTDALDARTRRSAAPADAFRSAFLTPGPRASEVRRILLKHAAASGLDVRALRPLFERQLETRPGRPADAACLAALRAARWTVFEG